MKEIRRIFSVLLAAALLLLPAFGLVGAAGTEVSLSVHFAVSEKDIPNARFDLYKVGEFETDTTFVLIGEFASEFSLEGVEGHEGWDALALEMRDFADGNEIEPLMSELTDDGGELSFGTLSGGLYLVVGRDVEFEENIYTSLPFLVSLPSWDAEAAEWVYDVTAMPKPGVVEPVPTPTPTPEPTPTPTPTPVPTETPEPTDTPEPTESPEPTPEPTPEPLPQTGMLWRPVFWLLAAGALLIAGGLIWRFARR